MPISRLLVGSKLSPEEIARLNAAYSYALRSLSLVDRDDPLCEIVARKVLEVGAVDHGDPRQIAGRAVKKLGLQ